jgi:hypothetical protein
MNYTENYDAYQQDVNWLRLNGYKFSKRQAIIFCDIVTRNYANDKKDIEKCRKEAAMTLNLS